MNKRSTRGNNRSKGRLASLKQTNLIIYLAIAIIFVGICGALYNNYTNKADSKLPLAASNSGQAGGLNNGNSGNESLGDGLAPASTLDLEEEQESAEDYEDVKEEPAPTASSTTDKEENRPTETPKPAQTEQPSQAEKDAGNKLTEAPAKTVKLPAAYVVQKGDTLRSISEKFYQSKEHYALIAEYNHIVFINNMKPGDTLKIPVLPSTAGSKDGSQQGRKDYSKLNLPITYLIQAGDTLSEVSRMFYKSAEYVDDIAKENKLDKNAGLEAGTTLVIPSLKKDKPANHTVKSGETLYSISKKYYGSDKYVKLIASYNHLADIEDVKAGTVLKLPKA
ncbi:LysM peptidoglycan-binding domain-containing protein [Paenibacillus sp. N4]|uniref:LysM peptidoglycan-binding domain-containing protein n=1 Tax=Paenibacillus vietnamensis TaxID=2590547 RepID=UPI001CD0E39D|nr:LysM peptidoglycan-binding domain-containing protein [Paenibacillus vietnamensis]MCA0757057.1 LysM peptidoglycan-binding domain-containing protein [Paenibacillus vietnamensis]